MKQANRCHTRRGFLLAGLGLAAAAGAHASSVLPMDLRQLSRAARHVVAGRIASVTAERDPRSGHIFSRVTLKVFQAEPAQLTGRDYEFRMIGGEIDGERQYIADFPAFNVGDSVVLFLASTTSTVFGPTVGLWQGVFFVDGEGETASVVDAERRLVSIDGDRLVRPAGGSAALTAPGASKRGVSFGRFFEEVRRFRSGSVAQ